MTSWKSNKEMMALKRSCNAEWRRDHKIHKVVHHLDESCSVPPELADTLQALDKQIAECNLHSFEAFRQLLVLSKVHCIPKVVIALNKIDLLDGDVQDNYCRAVEVLEAQIRISGRKLDSVTFVPTCGLSGVNLVRSAPEELPWCVYCYLLLPELHCRDIRAVVMPELL